MGQTEGRRVDLCERGSMTAVNLSAVMEGLGIAVTGLRQGVCGPQDPESAPPTMRTAVPAPSF